MQLIKTMKNLSKVSQIYKDDIQLKISKIYGSVNPQVNTYYYSRKIKDLIKDFNQSNKLARKEDICSEKTILLISYADNLKICLLYTSPSPRDLSTSRMQCSA